jgi:hypothetical protein
MGVLLEIRNGNFPNRSQKHSRLSKFHGWEEGWKDTIGGIAKGDVRKVCPH